MNKDSRKSLQYYYCHSAKKKYVNFLKFFYLIYLFIYIFFNINNKNLCVLKLFSICLSQKKKEQKEKKMYIVDMSESLKKIWPLISLYLYILKLILNEYIMQLHSEFIPRNWNLWFINLELNHKMLYRFFTFAMWINSTKLNYQ